MPPTAVRVEPSDQVVSTPRGPVGYTRSGHGPAVVLLAGLGSRRQLWGELPRLLARRFTVLAPDNRGVGASRGGESFTLQGSADDAAAVVADAGAGPAAVVGVSMGGLIACHLAARHPGAVRSLIIASCPARLTPSHRRILRFFELALTRLPPSEAAELLMTFAFSAAFADRYPGFVQEAAGLWEPGPDDVAGALAQVGHLAGGFDLASEARSIACPTLVLAGELDPLVPAAETEHLATLIAGARLRRVAGAAHSVLAEGGQELLDEVVTFLGMP